MAAEVDSEVRKAVTVGGTLQKSMCGAQFTVAYGESVFANERELLAALDSGISIKGEEHNAIIFAKLHGIALGNRGSEESV